MNTSKRIMIVTGIALMAGFIVMLATSRTPYPLEFEPIDGQIALLDKAHEEWFGQPTDPNDINAVPTICDWINYKGRVALDDGSMESEQAILHVKRQLEADLSGLIANTSFSAIYWIGEQAFEQLAPLYESKSDARRSIVAMCQSRVPDIDAIIDAEIAAFDQLDDIERLRGDNGAFTPQTRIIASLLHRHLWFSVVSEFYPASKFESPEERTAFLRWQIELSAMPIPKKIEKLEQLIDSGLPYDFAFAKAVLYSKAGQPDVACQTLKDALANDSKELTEFRKARYQDGLNEIRKAHHSACP